MKKQLLFGIMFNDACLLASGYAFGAGEPLSGSLVLVAGLVGALASVWYVKSQED